MFVVSTLPPPLRNLPTLQSTGNRTGKDSGNEIGNSVCLLTFHSSPPSNLAAYHGINSPSAKVSGDVSGYDFVSTPPILDKITGRAIPSTCAATPATRPAKTATRPARISAISPARISAPPYHVILSPPNACAIQVPSGDHRVAPATSPAKRRTWAASANRAQYSPKPHHKPIQPNDAAFTITIPATPAKNRQRSGNISGNNSGNISTATVVMLPLPTQGNGRGCISLIGHTVQDLGNSSGKIPSCALISLTASDQAYRSLRTSRRRENSQMRQVPVAFDTLSSIRL